MSNEGSWGTFLGNTPWAWGSALAVAAGTFVALLLARRLLLGTMRRSLRAEDPGIADLVARLLHRTWLVLLALSLYAGSLALELPRTWHDLFEGVAVTALLLQIGLWASGWFSWWIERTTLQRRAVDPAAVTSLSVIGYVGRLLLWAAIALLVLDNLGVQVTTLVAGLGIGGIAVALAVQNILKDLFASLSIVLDRPFEVGDAIVVGDVDGVVEFVGLKTTRIRSVRGEQVIVPNGDLLASRIRNFKRMDERRIVFVLSVPFQTPPAQAAAIPGLLREVVEAQPLARFDRAHLREFGEWALRYEVVYFVRTADYMAYMDAQQAINLEILRRFADAGISFAVPTRDVHVRPDAGAWSSPPAPGIETSAAQPPP